MKRDTKIEISKDQIEFIIRGHDSVPLVVQLTGLDEKDDFVLQCVQVSERPQPGKGVKVFEANISRGIFLIQADPIGLLVLMPERLEINFRTAAELLLDGLPAPREYPEDAAADLQFFLKRGLTWSAASRRIKKLQP